MMSQLRTLGALALLLLPSPALAHGSSGESIAFEPWLGLPLLLSGMLYLTGSLRLAARRHRPGGGRRTLLFAGGWLLLALPLATPLHLWGGRSFAAHMVEHEIIMVLAAPLLALARPLGVLLWGIPGGVRRRLVQAGRQPLRGVWRPVTGPLTATALQTAVLWLWHIPAAFEAAVHSPVLHALQHMSFLASAVLFWWALAFGRAGRHGYGLGALCQFLTALQSGLLGALLTLAGTPWYPTYAIRTEGRLSPLEDQQLAGIVMWIPAGLVHAGAAFVLIALWLNGPRRRPGRNRDVLWAE
ncbi:cytochrome c oxidase assembly protein [Azospirillum melinis]|uniref:Cytochrome c oxidase assembly protein n=1 Tax=Azospirillum melinis TaxID=328839 RepID=A0ABX2K679_9PROT|nr:cytochrome c oxidase assembly protein [Azospirillum melinis]MBP2310605.1 cytochrome c oxidase assembly factor CtaG [Azospirillum melinis]NUA99069.1 cytochrome c oxidase assembly protein [Azospirillum melinis]